MTDITKKWTNASEDDLQKLEQLCLSFEEALEVFRKLLDILSQQRIPGCHYPLNHSPNKLNEFVPKMPAELKEVADFLDIFACTSLPSQYEISQEDIEQACITFIMEAWNHPTEAGQNLGIMHGSNMIGFACSGPHFHSTVYNFEKEVEGNYIPRDFYIPLNALLKRIGVI